VADTSPVDRDLQRLEADLKRLEAEYNMFFAGRLPKPPWETRSRVESLVKQYDRAYIPNNIDRFRFLTLQSRFATFADLWDRGLRSREEGRAGPFSRARPQPRAEADTAKDRIVHVVAFHDPLHELDKLHDLYDAVAAARHEVGAGPVPFHKFADLVRDQVQKLRKRGTNEVAFRVALKDGKVNFTARALAGARTEKPGAGGGARPHED
jgi:hypothetical protein